MVTPKMARRSVYAHQVVSLLLIVIFNGIKPSFSESYNNDGSSSNIKYHQRINHYTMIGMPPDSLTVPLEDKINLWKVSLPKSSSTFGTYNGGDDGDNEEEDDDDDCFYFVYPSQTGAQLWGVIDRKNVFGGFEPHYEGESRVKICILSKTEKPFLHGDDGGGGAILPDGDNPVLDGTFVAVRDEYGHAMEFLSNYLEENGGISVFQHVTQTDKGIVFAGYGFMDPDSRESFCTMNLDCRNFGFFGKHTPTPMTATIQLAAFVQQIKTFDSVEAYYESVRKEEKEEEDMKEEEEKEDSVCATDDNDDDKPRSKKNPGPTYMASQFFGVGNFGKEKKDAGDDNNKAVDPSNCAWIVGHVVKVELKTNELTGMSFYWALIRTAGDMEVDVVIHPRLLEVYQAKPPRVGGVIRCYCWLSCLLKPAEGYK